MMRIVFMGSPQPAVASLKKLLEDGHEIVAVYTQPDRPAGRGWKMSAPPVKQFALEQGLKVMQPLKLRNQQEIEIFRSHEADVAVVVAYGKILPKEFLEAFPHGAINVHFSLLPRYRGAAPVNWAIANGEKNTGVTIMLMDEGLDTGDILLQEEVAIEEQETAIELIGRLSLIGAELLSKVLKNLDNIEPKKQSDELATYAPMLRKTDGLINWSMSAFEIVNRVRAFQPFPTCYSYLRGRKITIWKASATQSNESDFVEVGTVTKICKDSFEVACGSITRLRIDELQPEGKKRMKASDFLNGWRISQGEKFSSNNELYQNTNT